MTAPARPFVTANFAVTWDGRVSTIRRTPSDFSSPRDKRQLVEIRSDCDAILVSAKTAATDNMTMGVPDEELRAQRRKRGLREFPVRVLLSRTGRIDPKLRLFTHNFSPIVVFSTTRMPARTRKALAPLADLRLHEGEGVDLAAMLAALRKDYGVRRLVCEGGPQILRALLINELIDEIHVTLCPRVFGGVGAPTLSGDAGDFLLQSRGLKLREMKIVEDECFLRYAVAR